MAKTKPAQFLREVRQEANKVTWPSRKETGISTIMVFIMVFLAAIFFFLIDQFLAWGVKQLFGIGA
ncbi:MAG: preprotein translocase subunit SecE [Magnetospiraceae bacterium]